MWETIKAMLSRLLYRAAEEVLEEVDDILSDFQSYVDRLQASAAANAAESEAMADLSHLYSDASEYHAQEAERAENVAKKIRELIG